MNLSDQLREIASAAVTLVRETSSGVARELADAVLAESRALPDAGQDRRWIAAVASPTGRQSVSRFLTHWARSAPDITTETAAGALAGAAEASDRRSQDEQIEIVWTGPRTGSRPLRRTEQVLLQILESSTRRLTIASYAVFRIPRIGSALAAAASRGVAVRILIERESDFDTLTAIGSEVARHCEMYEWPASGRPTRPDGRPALMHLKFVAADSNVLYVSSANLTDYALEGNMELGLVVRGSAAAAEVERHFDELISRNTICRVRL